MASPQTENGHTRISNELFNALLSYEITGGELKVVLKIIRDTYGWSQKKAQISYGSIARATGIDRRHVRRVCDQLKAKNVLFMQPTAKHLHANIMGINKNYETWDGFSQVVHSEDESRGVQTPMQPTGGGVQTPIDGGVQTPSLDQTRGVQTPRDRGLGAPPLKKGKKVSLNKGKESPPLENNSQEKKAAELLKGMELLITNGDPRPLVNKFYDGGFELSKIWAAIIQARPKKHPPSYFVKIIGTPGFTLSDTAHELAKMEMRKWGY